MIQFRRAAHALALFALLAWVPVSASATKITLFADLDGSQEVPAVSTSGLGSAAMIFDTTTNVIEWAILYTDVSSQVFGVHFHSAPAGVNGGIIINIGAISPIPTGTSGVLTGSAVVPTGEVSNLLNEGWYINIHTVNNGTGEIRGLVQNATAQVPEPMLGLLFFPAAIALRAAASRRR